MLDDYRYIELATVDSTNTQCIEYAKNGDPGNLWIRAKTQTAARGSRGRDWQSDEGNLFASLLLLNPAEGGYASVLSGLTFVTSLALLWAIKEISNDANVKLKWPNDVLVNEKKCAGILLENQNIQGKTALVIGIGVNCTSHPSNTNYPATDLISQGIAISAEELFMSLVTHMDGFIKQWDRGRNFAEIRQSWLKHAVGLGKPIRVKIPGQADETGIFETIDETGLLILDQENGTKKRISAADIFFNG
ncbi:MAG: biotin--[acetyl-CoA-carboxylase] ligase [Rhizobiaceae bacterium]|nr:biotin--[acetyl-CoA-carboxylase] ligase [Rhizobiaceae bacterium]